MRPTSSVLTTFPGCPYYSLDLHRDVESMVADPAFAGTTTEEVLRNVCQRYEIDFAWHCGFRLPVREVPADFRGPVMPELARRVAGDGDLDAATIGAAEGALHSQPDRWRDIGTPTEVLQYLKQLWHVLVHHGKPVT